MSMNDEKHNDFRASLLLVDPSATVKTETLPISEWPAVIDGYTRDEMHRAIENGDTKIAFSVLGVVSHYYAEAPAKSGNVALSAPSALGCAAKIAAFLNSNPDEAPDDDQVGCGSVPLSDSERVTPER